MDLTNPFMSAFINQLTNTTLQHHAKAEQETAQDVATQRDVYQKMVQSDDPHVQALGLTGLMEKPKKDMFGHLKKSENWPQVQNFVNSIRSQTQAPPMPPQPGPPPPTAGQAPPPPMSLAQAPPGQNGQATPPNPQVMAGAGPGATQGSGEVPMENAPPTPQPTNPNLHPADEANVHPQGVQTYDQMLALSRSQDPFGIDPQHRQFRATVQQLQLAGIPEAEGRKIIYDRMQPAGVAAAQARGGNALAAIEEKNAGALAVQGEKGKLARELASGKYAEASRAEDVHYAHQRALKQLGLNASDQKVTWQDMRDPNDPNGIATIRVPISQATAKSMAASGQSLNSKIPGVIVTRLTSAIAAKKRIEHVQSYVDELADHIGLLKGQISSTADLLGVQDPVIQRFLTDRTQIAAYMTSVHAARGKAFLDAMEKGIGQLKDNPAAFKTALEESVSGMDDFIDTTKPPSKSGGPPSPAAAGVSGGKDPNRPIKVKGETKPFSAWPPDIQQRVLAAGG